MLYLMVILDENHQPFMEIHTFRRFHSAEEAEELVTFLQENAYDAVVEKDATNFDPSFSNNDYENVEYLVKIPSHQFEAAEELMEESFGLSLDDIEPSHYIFDFTDQELLDILKKQDEWSSTDRGLAKELLAKRGKTVTKAELDEWKKKRLTELSKPVKLDTSLMIMGYLMAIAGSVVGIAIGIYIKRHKKILPDGNQVYVYSEEDRAHGNYMIALAIITAIIGATVWMVL